MVKSPCGETFKNYNGLAMHSRYCQVCTLEAIFWARVDKSAGQDRCWIYNGFRKWDGYGWLARKQPDGKTKYMTSHRYAWILTHGEPEAGKCILHTCDNPPCCNPAHLYLGTQKDNSDDKMRRGRFRHRYTRPEDKVHPLRVRPKREAA